MQVVTQPDEPTSLVLAEPRLEIIEDCVYAPIRGSDLHGHNFWENKHWGIYDKHDRLVDGAAFCYLPNEAISGQSKTCLVETSDLQYAPRQRYFYVGNLINHYGHFLCSSMSRLWALPHVDNSRVPALGHAEGQPSDWFSWPFVRPLFGAAGLIVEDFASFREPIRVRELVVAHPSFVERNRVHRIYAESMNMIGDRLAKTADKRYRYDVVYLSKSRFVANPNGISNEQAIVERLEACGIPIVFPETLPLGDQIALFQASRCIIAQCGSALHTSIFSRPRQDQLIISIIDKPSSYSSNHAMFDAANGRRSIYVYFAGEWRPREGALHGLHILDPDQAARDLIALAQSG